MTRQRNIAVTICLCAVAFCGFFALYNESKNVNTTETTASVKSTIETVKESTIKEKKSKKKNKTKTIEVVKKEVKETVKETQSTKATTMAKKIQGVDYSVPSVGGSFKSYTNYQLLSKSSPQWTQIQCNSNTYTDNNGLRKVGDYYCVAMGSYYSRTLGDLFEITTENGTFKVIICDWKADCHTDSTNSYTIANNCVVEFYVDGATLNPTIRQMGNASYAEKRFQGNIIKIVKLGNYFT